MTTTKPDEATQITLDRMYYCKNCGTHGAVYSVALTTCPQCGSTNVTVSGG